MDRNREARRGTIAATVNGLLRRRQRGSSFRDSPEEDGAVELQETVRLRDRGCKKDRDLDRERDRDRDRSSRSKRRGGEALLHGGNREEGGEESTEDSADDEEEEEDEDAAMMAVQLPPMNPTASAASASLSTTNHHQRKSFPTKFVRSTAMCKVADEMIGASVPRKARSASVKRSPECWTSGGGGGGGTNGGEPIPRQASISPARPSAVASVPAAPISPPSSNASVRKKMKPIGNKHRPPKVLKMSSNQETEIEMEIAEVLYGMTRFQCSSKQEIVTSSSQNLNSRDANGSSIVEKSRGSSPIAISPSTAVTQSSLLPQNSSSTATAIAPKRKRAPSLKSEVESPANFAILDASVSSSAKIEVEQPAKVEISSPKSEKRMATAVENGWSFSEIGSSQITSVPAELLEDTVKKESNPITDSVVRKAEQDGQNGTETKDEIVSPVEKSPCDKMDTDQEDATTSRPELSSSIVDCLREKFNIDLMACPSGKSSPERDDMADLVTDQKPLALEPKLVPKDTVMKAKEDKAEGIVEEEGKVDELTENQTEAMAEDLESEKQVVKERIPDLQLDVEKLVKDDNKLPVQKQPTTATRNESKAAKTVKSASLLQPMTVAGWQGGLRPIGYMGQIPPPLPAVVSMDGGTHSSTTGQSLNLVLPQPRPKRCATHCYIAQNINYHRQFAQMNPFWPVTAGSTSLFGTKPCNLNVIPPTESALLDNPLLGTCNVRNLSSLQDKGGAAFTGHTLQDKNSPAIFMDTAQRKQPMLQQAAQPASANNILPPAFIFPLNPQHPATTTRAGAVKSVSTIGNAGSSSSAANLVVGSSASSGLAAAPSLSFNHANLPTSDAQYLAMLHSNGYPFPLPAHFGVPQPYRGSHHPGLPYFNGSFYSPQMLHPSQLQQQQPQSLAPAIQPGNQKTNTSSGSSSSQKHQQQQRLQGCVGNGGGRISQVPTVKQCQQSQQQYLPPHHSRQHESELGNEDSPSTADNRVLHAQKSVFNHNFTMPIHPQNFTIMTPAASGGGNQSEKQQQSLKGGMELNQSQAFAMSFATFNGAAAAPASSLDFSSMAQNHAVFQSFPESARHWYQIAASAASSQSAQQKNHQAIEEGKPVCDSINSNASGEDERKMTGKALTTVSNSLTFSRSDNDPSISTNLGNSVVDSSSRTLNALPASGNGNRTSSRSGGVSPATTSVTYTPNSQPHQQQLIQLQQQLAARMKSASSNANVYSDRRSGGMAKFPNAVSVFPQALPQGSGLTQSAQWKNSAKSGTTPVPSPSQASTPSAKSIPQQQGRTQPGVPAAGHTQISFGVDPKLSSSGQQFPSSNLSPSSAGSFVGSPPSSMSRNAGGSPKTTTGNMAGPSTMLFSSQPAKNTPSSSSRKSSPVSGRHVPSILSNSNVSSAQSSIVKPQQQQPLQNQHQQQQQLLQQSFQQAQAYFPNIYMQAQPPQSTSTSATSGYYQRRQSEQQQQQQQQNLSAVPSTRMVSLSSPPVTSSGPATSDPAKAVAAAAAASSNLKGLPAQGFLHAAQFATQSAGNPHLLMSAAIPYIQSVPGVPVKPAEQKPAAGN